MVQLYKGDDPSSLYLKSLKDLIMKGDEVSPRGKIVKELRPVIFEFTNPLKRVTFLRGRMINPFFQLAEALWIMAGRADVDYLDKYNTNMINFSDDGVHFNAPYGERLRFWNRHSLSGNTPGYDVDQFEDVYSKIKSDPDTRQAVAVIYNPLYDNFEVDTKDRPCNLLLSFKLRNGKLDLSVYNRSNDVHWGTFGANLCQFSTILEMMASWLGVKVGTYYQITDSLHVYLDEYGSSATGQVLKNVQRKEHHMFYFEDEPRISSSRERFQYMFATIFGGEDYPAFQKNTPLIQGLHDNETFLHSHNWESLLNIINNCPDEYVKLTLQAMFAYRAHRNENEDAMIFALSSMKLCSWKISCLRFLYKRHKNLRAFTDLYEQYNQEIQYYIERQGEW